MSRSSGRTPVLSARAKEASSARQARGEAGRKKSSQGFAELVQQREREVEACGGEESAGEEDLVELVEIRTSGTYSLWIIRSSRRCNVLESSPEPHARCSVISARLSGKPSSSSYISYMRCSTQQAGSSGIHRLLHKLRYTTAAAV